MAAEKAAQMAESCLHMRVSEAVGNTRARKLLGRPTAEMCQQAAERWRRRATDIQAETMALIPPGGKLDPKSPQQRDAMAAIQKAAFESFFDMCRDIGAKLAGRPLEIVWCTSWGTPGRPPDAFWDAIDGSPFEGMAAKQSSRDERLREVLERRLAKEWDQLQVKADLEGIAFVCGVWTPQGKLDRNITTASPKLNCTAYVSEMAAAPSRGLLLFTMQINVTVKFSEAGGPRGWQQIEVRTGEGHL
jgi:hypothetical protein